MPEPCAVLSAHLGEWILLAGELHASQLLSALHPHLQVAACLGHCRWNHSQQPLVRWKRVRSTGTSTGTSTSTGASTGASARLSNGGSSSLPQRLDLCLLAGVGAGCWVVVRRVTGLGDVEWRDEDASHTDIGQVHLRDRDHITHMGTRSIVSTVVSGWCVTCVAEQQRTPSLYTGSHWSNIGVSEDTWSPPPTAE